jgi:hypothetical protein
MTRSFPDPAALQTATRFSSSLRSRRPSLLACAIGKNPPLARPRPRELAVRLEEDRAHASLGQATPDDFCNTRHDARTHPSSDQSSSVNYERPRPLFAPAFAGAPNPRFHRAICFRSGTAVKTSRASRFRSRREPRAAERRTCRLTGKLPSSNRSLEHPGRRILASGGLETPPLGGGHGLGPLPPPPREGRRFPKDRGALRCFGTQNRWLTLAALLLERGARLLPCTRSGSAQCHAAPHVSVIAGALLQRVAPFFPSLSAPRPDEPSAARRFGRAFVSHAFA